MEKDFKMFMINYFCLCIVAFAFAPLAWTLQGWCGWVFSCSKWCWKWFSHFPEGSFPFWGNQIEPGWAESSVSVSAAQALTFPFLPGPSLAGPGVQRAWDWKEGLLHIWGQCFCELTKGLVLIFPSPLESTKMQVPCPGFWPLASHRIFHRVNSVAHVVWKELIFVTKAFWGVWKKMTHIHCSAIRGESVITHFNDKHNAWCIIRF